MTACIVNMTHIVIDFHYKEMHHFTVDNILYNFLFSDSEGKQHVHIYLSWMFFGPITIPQESTTNIHKISSHAHLS